MKYCGNCGAPLSDDTRFCGACGAPVESAVPAAPADPVAKPDFNDGPRVLLCTDGKYHWTSPMNMYKNPTIFLTVCKIFGIIGGIAFALFLIMSIADGNFNEFVGGLKYWGIAVLVFLVIAALAYLIVAGMYGGKYVVRFTMDEHGLLHEQIPEQARKARKLGAAVSGAGILTGNVGRTGQGMMIAAHTSLSSDFSKVRGVKPKRRWKTIKVNEPFAKNEVYTEAASYLLREMRANLTIHKWNE